MIAHIRHQLKLLNSGFIWGAFAYAAVLLTATLLLETLQIVDTINAFHVKRMYDYGFPLFSILLFSQLYAEDLENGTLRWMLSLPLNAWTFLANRWLVGVGLLAMTYFGSLAVIHVSLVELPWGEVSGSIFLTSLWLGHLAMLLSLAGKNHIVGLAVPLGYWVFESLSVGSLTGKMFLFLSSFPAEPNDLWWNRGIVAGWVVVVWLLSGWLIGRRSYFLKA